MPVSTTFTEQHCVLNSLTKLTVFSAHFWIKYQTNVQSSIHISKSHIFDTCSIINSYKNRMIDMIIAVISGCTLLRSCKLKHKHICDSEYCKSCMTTVQADIWIAINESVSNVVIVHYMAILTGKETRSKL